MNPKIFTIVFFTFLAAFLIFTDKSLPREELIVEDRYEIIFQTTLDSDECDRTKFTLDRAFLKIQRYDIEVRCVSLNPDK